MYKLVQLLLYIVFIVLICVLKIGKKKGSRPVVLSAAVSVGVVFFEAVMDWTFSVLTNLLYEIEAFGNVASVFDAVVTTVLFAFGTVMISMFFGIQKKHISFWFVLASCVILASAFSIAECIKYAEMLEMLYTDEGFFEEISDKAFIYTSGRMLTYFVSPIVYVLAVIIPLKTKKKEA